ncbi:sortase [Streptomyces agglomeratus]|uniref:Sortase n=1 Tax=Streptomyces agglomeratus TaxID=285458 RepID=A0A1E5P2I0_9ACTN|nr:sortase [Streptomyces agglomeratus]OEJ23712.1 sortase [Streptomyces agglomeratus]OEJ43304.1 sortase [Streptomyces agglomeratus]OEJ54777.1 sortase [Streptomyces agglomeratus]OEJ62150.1 sortase [Streptomyces agglomeratus]
MFTPRPVPAALAGACVAALVGCATAGSDGAAGAPAPAPVSVSLTPDTAPAGTATIAGPAPSSSAAEPAVSKSGTRQESATMAIPSIGVQNLRVVPYEGTTDDWAGTKIQDRGVAASPYGKGGGVGPGEVGNYLVTAHRLSAGGPLRELPSVQKGGSVFVTSEGKVYEYEITGTRTTSFRSERSLAEQRAAVPGSPGERPTKPMITISTCATPEDDAAGNFWRDDKGNPEHRIDKIGVLVSTRTVAGG